MVRARPAPRARPCTCAGPARPAARPEELWDRDIQGAANRDGCRGTRAASRRDRPVTAILHHPALYQAWQNAGGLFGARVKAIADYVTLACGMRVIDIVAFIMWRWCLVSYS